MLGLRGLRFGPRSRRPGITLVIALSVVAGAASYVAAGSLSGAATPTACRHRPASGTFVVSGTPGAVAAGVASALFGCAPTVVVANADRLADVAVAVAAAEQAHAPLLLSSPLSARTVSYRGAPGARPAAYGGTAALREINDLHPRNVLAIGLTSGDVSAELPGAEVTTNPGGFARMSPPAPQSRVVVLVPAGNSAAAMAAAA